MNGRQNGEFASLTSSAEIPVSAATIRRAHGIASEFFADGMEHDDLTQEALIGAVEARRTFDDRGPFGPFERLCMRGRVIEAVRKSRRLKNSPLTEAVRADDHLTFADPRADTPMLVERRDTIRLVIAALPSLSPTQLESFHRQVNDLPLNGKRDDNGRLRAKQKLLKAAA